MMAVQISGMKKMADSTVIPGIGIKQNLLQRHRWQRGGNFKISLRPLQLRIWI